MPKDMHQRAAEFHDLAAHAHRVAATHHGKEDHQTGHEHSRQALEHSATAYRFAQEAHRKSASSVGEREEKQRSVSDAANEATAVPKDADMRAAKPIGGKSSSQG